MSDAIQGEELARFDTSRSNLVGTVIFSLFIVVIIVTAICLRSVSYAFLSIPPMLGLLHTLDEGTKSVGIYQSGIIIKSILRKRTYSYKELDGLRSYNVLNFFHKGVSYGYCFFSKGKQIIAMDIRQYPTIAQIETVFETMPDILDNRALIPD